MLTPDDMQNVSYQHTKLYLLRCAVGAMFRVRVSGVVRLHNTAFGSWFTTFTNWESAMAIFVVFIGGVSVLVCWALIGSGPTYR